MLVCARFSPLDSGNRPGTQKGRHTGLIHIYRHVPGVPLLHSLSARSADSILITSVHFASFPPSFHPDAIFRSISHRAAFFAGSFLILRASLQFHALTAFNFLLITGDYDIKREIQTVIPFDTGPVFLFVLAE
mgnify:CR=1 FL=1